MTWDWEDGMKVRTFQGFDPDGEPVLKVLDSGNGPGQTFLHLNFNPPEWVQGAQDGMPQFAEQLQQSIGLPVRQDDRELFVIDRPNEMQADALFDKVQAFLTAYRQKMSPQVRPLANPNPVQATYPQVDQYGRPIGHRPDLMNARQQQMEAMQRGYGPMLAKIAGLKAMGIPQIQQDMLDAEAAELRHFMQQGDTRHIYPNVAIYDPLSHATEIPTKVIGDGRYTFRDIMQAYHHSKQPTTDYLPRTQIR